MAGDETTPLLPNKGEGKKNSWLRRVFHVEHRILLAGFLITLAFSFTQVPLFYVFHLMTCDTFYDSHPPYDGPGDRCSRDEIAAGTATQFSILGMSTTFCGTMNLFLAGWTAKKFGPRAALLVQIFIPAIRVVTQILGVLTGKREGMLIIQATQLITILGGPAGYILVINIIAGEVVEPIRRTAVFGRLQGAIMLGQGVGYLTGGMLGDIDIKAPFETSFCCFILSGIYVWIALPYISPESMTNGEKRPTGFLTPLKILTPQKLRLADGKTKKHLGVVFLCAGIFLGVLATDYAPLLIQMYATAAFSFTQGDNGWLMSEFAIMRSFFLIFLFPRIIAWGRGWYVRSETSSEEEVDETATQHIPTTAGEFDATVGEQADHEPYRAVSSNKEDEGTRFDLVFLRYSLVVDGILTTVSGFATQRWHIYLDSQRADALNAVTLVENIARLATQGLFGFIFASLAQVGKAYATFFCNAAIAMIGMAVLLFSNFPPLGGTLIEKDDDEEEEGQTGTQEDEPLLNDRE
ncbi:major facilitator superfamily transporter [Fusarium flagelliforme]|uniref:Major facilitator superfamily transporter n=1 Tax=Fusarium flagelliforme TaxID=2675880 RepID=A0A395MJB4_9HYPO|nr:major facilitator superfamily transporter [Fusarium flagelliforme]